MLKLKIIFDFSKLQILFSIFQKTYTCHCNGKETSAKLKVTEAPLRFTKGLYNTSFKPGTSVKLVCELNKPNLDIVWRCDSDIVKENRKISVKIEDGGKRHVLEIDDFDEEDRGKYSAKCSTVTCETEGIVDVAVKPAIFIDDSEITTKYDGNVEVIASYKAIPKPKVTLYKVSVVHWNFCFSIVRHIKIEVFHQNPPT